MPVVHVVGIEITEGEAALRPKPSITTDIQTLNAKTNGKIHVSLEVLKNGSQFAMQMLFDNQQVKIKDHEKGMSSTLNYTKGRYETYSVEIPSKLLTVQKEPHIIQFIVGRYEDEKFIESFRSRMFELFIPSETPVIDPKVKPEDQD